MACNSVAVWDFTLGENFATKDQVVDWLEKYCKKWCFQVEEGKEGCYLHYQGRCSLKNKSRAPSRLGTTMISAHFSPTSNENRDNDFYASKEDTRVRGPWKDTDEKPLYVPKQVRDIDTLYSWQQDIVDSAKIWDTRTINIIWDKHGNVGKSILAGYITVHNIGVSLPPLNDCKDLMRIIMDLPAKPLYIIDMPRAMRKEKLYAFFSGIETLKSGYCYDDRYHFRHKYIDCPNIWVFTNFLPDLKMLSADRWKFWGIEHVRHASREDYYKYAITLEEIKIAQGLSDQKIPCNTPSLQRS